MLNVVMVLVSKHLAPTCILHSKCYAPSPPPILPLSETQTSCSSFGESPSILQIVIAGFKRPLMLRAGRREDELAAAKLSGSHWLNDPILKM